LLDRHVCVSRSLPRFVPLSNLRTPYLAAQYQRLRARRGHARATPAVADSMLVAAWAHAHHRRGLHPNPAVTTSARRDPERTTKRLIVQLDRLGYTVILEPKVAA
jgi:transposase